MALPPLPPTIDDIVEALMEFARDTPRHMPEIAIFLNHEFPGLGGRVTVDNVTAFFEEFYELHRFADGRVMRAIALLDGVVVTHRLTAEEISTGVIAVAPDFIEVEMVANDRKVFGELDDLPSVLGTTGWNQSSVTDDERALAALDSQAKWELRMRPFDQLVGDAHWLSGFTEGTLVGIRFGFDQDTWVGAVPEADVDHAFGRELSDLFVRAVASNDAPLDVVLLTMDYIYEALLDRLGHRPMVLPPFSELLSDAGLVWHDDRITTPDFDWSDWEVQRVKRLTENDETLRSLSAVTELAGHARTLLSDGPQALTADDLARCRELLRESSVRSTILDVCGHGEDLTPEFYGEGENREVGSGGGGTGDDERDAGTRGDEPSVGRMTRSRAFDPLLAVLASTGQRRDQANVALLRAQMARVTDPQLGDPTTAAFITSQLDQALAAEPRRLDVLEDIAWEELRRNNLGAARVAIHKWGSAGGIEDRYLDDDSGMSMEAFLLLTAETAIGSALVVRSVSVGRNDPCPCGSGRKYKQCCISKPLAATNDVSQRAALLHTSLGWFVMKAHPDTVDAVLNHLEASLIASEDSAFEAVMAAYEAVALSLEVVRNFANAMTPAFLGSGERALLACWAATPIAVWEVVARSTGQSVTLRNVRTADTHRVKSETIANHYNIGEYVLARPLPGSVGIDGTVEDGSEWQLRSGCLRIPMRVLEPLLAYLDTGPSTEDVYGWLGDPPIDGYSLSREPGSVRNTDGETLVMCTRRWPVEHPQSVISELRARATTGADDLEDSDSLEDLISSIDLTDPTFVAPTSADPSRLELWPESTTGDDPMVWTVGDPRPFNRLIVGKLRLSEGELEFETNSEERLDVVTNWLTEMLGLGEPLATRSESLEDAEYRMRLGFTAEVAGAVPSAPARPGSNVLGLSLFDPAVSPIGPELELDQRTQDQIRKQMENRWLTESVPALGGLTPRQAANDPTRRSDLIRLLDSFDRMPTGGWLTYDVARLRRVLGV